MLPPSIPSKVTSFVDNGELFATNLRLLNFDLLEDWPAITTKTFSTKDAQQNQKQRVRCIEWALFRLFELWDPQETRDVGRLIVPVYTPLITVFIETATFLSASRTSPVSEPPRCLIPIPQ